MTGQIGFLVRASLGQEKTFVLYIFNHELSDSYRPQFFRFLLATENEGQIKHNTTVTIVAMQWTRLGISSAPHCAPHLVTYCPPRWQSSNAVPLLWLVAWFTLTIQKVSGWFYLQKATLQFDTIHILSFLYSSFLLFNLSYVKDYNHWAKVSRTGLWLSDSPFCVLEYFKVNVTGTFVRILSICIRMIIILVHDRGIISTSS